MIVFDELNLPKLWAELSAGRVQETVAATLSEDGADNDLTTLALCERNGIRSARVVARESAVCAGLGLLDGFRASAHNLSGSVESGVADGMHVAAGTTLMHLHGPLSSILPIERALLNLLGIAMASSTLTARYVEAVRETRAQICDTRKTIPGLRWLQKYAVACGGGRLHRMALDDAILVKDNHVAGLAPSEYAQRICECVERVRAAETPLRFVCAEADTLEQFEALLTLPVGTLDIVLLDNFSVELLLHAVKLRTDRAPTLLLEASGGVRLETVAAIARTGVDRISVGALTHSAGSIDVALDMDD